MYVSHAFDSRIPFSTYCGIIVQHEVRVASPCMKLSMRFNVISGTKILLWRHIYYMTVTDLVAEGSHRVKN